MRFTGPVTLAPRKFFQKKRELTLTAKKCDTHGDLVCACFSLLLHTILSHTILSHFILIQFPLLS